MTWTLLGNIKGPKGDAGPAGPQGPQGIVGPTGNVGPQGPAGPTGNTGLQGPQGNAGAQGAQGVQGIQGAQGPSGAAGIALPICLLHPMMAASAIATNLAASAFLAVSDPNLRQMVDLRSLPKCKVVGRIGGSLVAATKLRVQYHPTGGIAVATGDAGWATLGDTAGSHTLNTLFESAELAVPAGAQVQNCCVRVGLFGGDGVADPTVTAAMLRFYQ